MVDHPSPRQAGALRTIGRGLLVAATLALSGCGALDHGIMNAAGPVAGGERHLLLEVLVVLAFVIGPVLLLTPLFAWHYRLSNTHRAYRPRWGFSWPLEAFIWIPPVLIVVGLAILLWRDTTRLDPYQPVAGAAGPALRVQVVALDWKWLFIYPDEHIATVNELDVPTGRQVHLDLTSGTVMQAILMPRLASQIYAMAGMNSQLNFAAAQPGVYAGENTQYNGDHFQDDKFKVVARTPADYARWVQSVHNGAPALDQTGVDRLLTRSVQPNPLVFSDPPAGLYQQLLARFGGASHAGMQDAR